MALESRKPEVQHSMHLRYPGSTLGQVGPSHDPLSHRLYCWDCPQGAKLVVIPWARKAATWHTIEAIRLILQSKHLTPSWWSCTMVPMEVPEDVSGHHEHRGLEIALPHPGWITGNLTNVQALWGSGQHFLKKPVWCMVHLGLWKNLWSVLCLTAFSRRALSQFSSKSLHSVIAWNMWSHGVCIYTSHKTSFTASVSIAYCEAPSEVTIGSPTGYCLLCGAHQFGCRIATAEVTFCSYELKKYKQGILKWLNNTI